jgi:hypothetical protein
MGQGPGVPTSTVSIVSGQVKYCVSGYASEHAVLVVDTARRVDTRLRTGFRGSGCITWQAPQGCARLADSAVATGVGADGNPATSTAVWHAPMTSTCAVSPTPTRARSALDGSVSLSGAGLLLLAVAGVALLGTIVVGVVAVRRKRLSAR